MTDSNCPVALLGADPCRQGSTRCFLSRRCINYTRQVMDRPRDENPSRRGPNKSDVIFTACLSWSWVSGGSEMSCKFSRTAGVIRWRVSRPRLPLCIKGVELNEQLDFLPLVSEGTVISSSLMPQQMESYVVVVLYYSSQPPPRV